MPSNNNISPGVGWVCCRRSFLHAFQRNNVYCWNLWIASTILLLSSYSAVSHSRLQIDNECIRCVHLIDDAFAPFTHNLLAVAVYLHSWVWMISLRGEFFDLEAIAYMMFCVLAVPFCLFISFDLCFSELSSPSSRRFSWMLQNGWQKFSCFWSTSKSENTQNPRLISRILHETLHQVV